MPSREDTYGKWNIEIDKGRDAFLTFDVLDSDGLPVDLTYFVILDPVIREGRDVSYPIIATLSVQTIATSATQFTLHLPYEISQTISQTYGVFDIAYKESATGSILPMGWAEVDFYGYTTPPE